MAMADARVLPSNLKLRLTGLVIVLVLAATVLVTMVALSMAERDMKGVVGAQQLAVVSSAAAFIDDRLDAKKSLVADLASRVPAAARGDPRQLQAWLDAHAGLAGDFADISMFGADARLLASLPAPAGDAAGAAGKPYFDDTLARKKGVVSAPLKSALANGPLVMVTAPLLDDAGKVALVVAGAIDLQRTALLRQIDLLKPGKTGFLFIMTGAGILVDHPDKSRLMQHIHQRPGINNATEMALSGYEGWIEAANKDGDDGIYSYKRLKAADWIVGARYPTAEAFAPMTNMRHRALLAGAAAALVAGLLAWLSIQRMLAPLESLRRSVSSIRRKRGGAEAAQGSRADDIGELGSAFHELLAEREAAQERSRGIEKRARMIADNLPALIGYINSEQRYEFANAHYLDMVGADPRSMLGKTVRETLGEPAYAKIASNLAAALRGQRVHFEQQLEIRGRQMHYMIDYIPDADDGRTAGVYVLVTDISERKNAELEQAASEKRLTLITDNLPVLIFHIDGGHRFRFGNATFEKWFGLAPAGLVGQALAEVFGDVAYQRTRPHLEHAFGGATVTFETRMAVAGSLRILETTFIPDVQGDGGVAGVYAITHDMTQMKEVEQKLTRLARVDTLTGIANRRMFVEALHLAIARARRGGGTMALAYLDIDHFKKTNDSYGHAVGDEVLKEFARRLAANVRATDTVARLAGDEFVIIFEELHGEHEAPAVAAKIAEAIRAPFEAGGVRLAITASVGVALFGGGGQTHAELLANADGALYAAKRAGRDGVVVHGS
jgi:diguanylate cyclase (GGDEF)-like protein/PAS domain S-box-containing protein